MSNHTKIWSAGAPFPFSLRAAACSGRKYSHGERKGGRSALLFSGSGKRNEKTAGWVYYVYFYYAEENIVMRRAGIFRVRARVGLEKVGFGLKSGSGLHKNYFNL